MSICRALHDLKEDAPQCDHPSREVLNGLHYMARRGISWRMMPNDLRPWYTVYKQTQSWLKAGVFTTMMHNLRVFLRLAVGRNKQSSGVIFDSRTLQSSPESGQRVGNDSAKRRKGSKTRMAVDKLGLLLMLTVTAADEQDRTQMGPLA